MATQDARVTDSRETQLCSDKHDADRSQSSTGANSESYAEESAEAYESGQPENPVETSDEKASDLSPIEKTKSKASINDVSAVPNGGIVAWMQVAGGFFLLFNSWGIINTFGAYQTFYESPQSIFSTSSSTISWIGSIQAFLLLCVGALTGPIYDAGHFRALILAGGFLLVFGHMMLSLCHAYWQALLAQAFCIGIGAGCLFVPAVAIIATYFTTKLPVAMGLVAAGSSLGGVIYPIVFHKLIGRIGFGWTVRVIGFIVLATQIFCAAAMKMRVKPAAKRSLVDWKAFTDVPYVLFVLGGTLGFCGLYVPFFYVQYYSIATGITDENLGFYLLTLINSASVFGRILPNLVAQSTGVMNMMVPCAVMSGVLPLVLIGSHTLAAVVVVSLLYGFFSGSFVSLPPSIFATQLSPQRGMIGTRMGMGFTAMSIGVLVGTPAAGAILGGNDAGAGGGGGGQNWTGTWVFSGVLVLGGACFIALSRMYKTGWKLAVKV